MVATQTIPAPVKLTNAACPRCDGPVWWCPRRWLHCRTCPKRVAITPAARRLPR